MLARDRRARRAHRAARPRGQLLAGRARPGPCGPCSELYLDRGLDFGGDDDRPGDDTERFLEFWNLVFMQYELHDGRLADRRCPTKNIDTGLGLDRMAAILQDVPSVFETDQFRPLVELGEELSGRRYGEDDFATTRALRILADHGRGDDVPDGRRRRALERGARLRAAPDHAPRDPAGPRARHRGAVPAARSASA